ncbi:hypothetical protein glysoja_010918 [Glycine soja]|nr:hypothetical protein glysoja_010918 [Glycine soja]
MAMVLPEELIVEILSWVPVKPLRLGIPLSSGRGNFEYWVRFWNPARMILSQESPHLRLRRRDYILLEDYVKFGFDYGDWSDTYKVAALCFNTKSQNWESEVGGTVNWLAFRMLGIDYEWNTVTVHQLVIFSYDLKKETYNLSMPDGLSEVPDYLLKVGVLKGCLSFGHSQEKNPFRCLANEGIWS